MRHGDDGFGVEYDTVINFLKAISLRLQVSHPITNGDKAHAGL